MIQHQRGMTIWSWLFVLGTIGFMALVAMKLFPIYMENMSVKRAINQVASVDGAASMNKKAAWGALVKQFYVDEVKSVSDENVDVQVNDDGVKELIISYEVRTTMLANVDVVVWFEERAPLTE